jgi:aspartate aminotransferase
MSCAEPDERIERAVAFLPEARSRTDRVCKHLPANARLVLREPYLMV